MLQVGTVLNLEDAKHAISHGAKFLLSPAMVMVWTEQKVGCTDADSCKSLD